MAKRKLNYISIFLFILLFVTSTWVSATEISDNTFLIAEINSQNFDSQQIWDLLQQNDETGIGFDIVAKNKNVFLTNSSYKFATVLEEFRIT
jgi:hypothetical protein